MWMTPNEQNFLKQNLNSNQKVLEWGLDEVMARRPVWRVKTLHLQKCTSGTSLRFSELACLIFFDLFMC